jgi:predicted Zn-dependent protease
MKALKNTIIVLVVVLLRSQVLAASQDDLKFGFHADRLLVTNKTIVFEDKLNRKMEQIAARLIAASEKPLGKYVIRVMNDPIINAYSVAGGYVYINTGLLDILESEDEVAFILGHEIAHTNQDDQVNYLVSAHQRKLAGEIVGTILGAALGVGLGMGTGAAFGPSYQSNPIAQQLTSQMVDVGLQAGQGFGAAMSVSMINGYGKKQELRADDLAISNMYQAGYDPEAAVGVFKRLAAIRDKLGSAKTNYASNLINAEPGLEQRLIRVQERLDKPGQKSQSNQQDP